MKVAIFGAGTMGSGIAQVFAAKGHTALMYASSVTSAQKHKDKLAASLQKRVEKGKMTQEAMDALMANVLVEEKSAAADADLIIECVKEDMATVRPGVMKKNAFDQAKADACQIVKPAFTITEDDVQTEVLEIVKAAKKLVDLIGADFIVSVGRGISKDVAGGIKLAEELAAELGGVVGGSRATIDSGWLSADHQVGQTGKTVHPKVYIALGISGAIQHKAGMQDSECIIAVNKNDTAPIFEIADYGICGDLFKVAPMRNPSGSKNNAAGVVA